MTDLRIMLKRSPRVLIVGNNTINLAAACDDLAESLSSAAMETATSTNRASKNGPSAETEPADRDGDTAASELAPRIAAASMPSSIANVITDASTKVVTPLGQSNAVPVLSGATHEVITAGEIGFGGVSEEEVAGLKTLLASTAEMVMELQEQHRQSLSEMQEVAVELASAAASWLVGVAIDRNDFAIDDLIRQALQQMEIDQPVRVRLNPADHELLKTLIKDPEGRGILANVSCADDPGMVRGSCRVESGRRILLSDMNSRLEDIRRSWMEKLDDSQIERRGDGSASRTLRRFPDRRETA